MLLPLLSAFLIGWQDDALAKPLALHELAVPAETVCAHLSTATGIEIKCAPLIRQDLVILVSKPRPAMELMKVLADHFDWVWERKGQGYILEPSPAFRRLALRGRAPFVSRDGGKISSEALNRLQKIRTGNVAAWTKELQDMEKRFGTEELSEEEQEKLSARYTLLQSLTDPEQRIALETLAALSADQQVRIMDDRLVFSNQPGPLEFPFPPRVQSLVDAALRKLRQEGQREATESSKENSLTYMLNSRWDAGLYAPKTDAAVYRFSYRRYSGGNITVMNAAHEMVSRKSVEAIDPPSGPDAEPFEPKLQKALAKPTPEEAASDGWREPLRDYARHMAQAAQELSLDVISDGYDAYIGIESGNTKDEKVQDYRAYGFSPLSKMAGLCKEMRNGPAIAMSRLLGKPFASFASPSRAR